MTRTYRIDQIISRITQTKPTGSSCILRWSGALQHEKYHVCYLPVTRRDRCSGYGNIPYAPLAITAFDVKDISKASPEATGCFRRQRVACRLIPGRHKVNRAVHSSRLDRMILKSAAPLTHLLSASGVR